MLARQTTTRQPGAAPDRSPALEKGHTPPAPCASETLLSRLLSFAAAAGQGGRPLQTFLRIAPPHPRAPLPVHSRPTLVPRAGQALPHRTTPSFRARLLPVAPRAAVPLRIPLPAHPLPWGPTLAALPAHPAHPASHWGWRRGDWRWLSSQTGTSIVEGGNSFVIICEAVLVSFKSWAPLTSPRALLLLTCWTASLHNARLLAPPQEHSTVPAKHCPFDTPVPSNLALHTRPRPPGTHASIPTVLALIHPSPPCCLNLPPRPFIGCTNVSATLFFPARCGGAVSKKDPETLGLFLSTPYIISSQPPPAPLPRVSASGTFAILPLSCHASSHVAAPV